MILAKPFLHISKKEGLRIWVVKSDFSTEIQSNLLFHIKSKYNITSCSKVSIVRLYASISEQTITSI